VSLTVDDLANIAPRPNSRTWSLAKRRGLEDLVAGERHGRGAAVELEDLVAGERHGRGAAAEQLEDVVAGERRGRGAAVSPGHRHARRPFKSTQITIYYKCQLT
jgi:hypothetical protein